MLLLSLFTTAVIGWNVLTQRKVRFKIECEHISFHELAFHRLIHVNCFNVEKACCRRTLENATVLIWIMTYFFVGSESAVIVPELTSWNKSVAQSLDS